MLYGMSLIFGLTGTTTLSGISALDRPHGDPPALLTVAIFLSLVGFAFKVSAVPFHFWAPDTYDGAPTPVTAFLSVASKAGGFVAMLNIVFFGFRQRRQGLVVGRRAARRVLDDPRKPRRAAADEPRAHAGLLVDRAGRLHPRAVRGLRHRAATRRCATSAFQATIVYLLIYGAMNLGAFAVLIAVARRTRSAEISSYAGPVHDLAGPGVDDDDLPGLARRASRRSPAGTPSS